MVLGSSSTAGSGASGPQRTYVGLLDARLEDRFPTVELTNLGAGGATIDRLLDHVPTIVTLAPQLVTILPLTDYVRTSTATFAPGYAALIDARLGGGDGPIGDLRIDDPLVCGTGSGPVGCLLLGRHPERARSLGWSGRRTAPKTQNPRKRGSQGS